MNYTHPICAFLPNLQSAILINLTSVSNLFLSLFSYKYYENKSIITCLFVKSYKGAGFVNVSNTDLNR